MWAYHYAHSIIVVTIQYPPPPPPPHFYYLFSVLAALATIIEHFHVTSREQNRAPFWCTALNYSEAGLPPYEAAVEHGAHKRQVGWKRRQMVPRAALQSSLTNKRAVFGKGQQKFNGRAASYQKVFYFSKVDTK